MINNDIGNPLIRLTPGQELKLSSPAHLLYVGRILKTAVVRPLAHNQVLININGNNINATTSHQFKPGELLNVKVIANNANEIVLQAMKPSKQSSPLARAMSHYLPRQLPAGPFYQILRHMLERHQMPAPLQTAGQKLLQTLPGQGNLAQQLAGAVHNSGLFLESRLLRQDKSLRENKDFKALLLDFLSRIPPSKGTIKHSGLENFQQTAPLPGELPKALSQPELTDLANYSQDQLLKLLHQQAEGVLARLVSYQLQQTGSNSVQPFQFFMDLPLKLNDSVAIIPLKIRQLPAKSRYKAPQWQVELAVELPELGAVQSRLVLHGQQLNVYFNTENVAGQAFLNQYQDSWRNLVTDMGLSMGKWQVAVGLIEEKPDGLNFQLIDIHL